ncbi:carboxypeptidase-like regulatory domain-containing protein [Acidicapsa ligni]|uniref:carboxypeptidase-like regulatory domain-containing protein n=1 Tax=Acidicapsa ligni TaxID=542300 RepID=UPI0021E0A816|nr:carboxypeptidase-like regulatory domain-containing protein [Acidicapsa ligni]
MADTNLPDAPQAQASGPVQPSAPAAGEQPLTASVHASIQGTVVDRDHAVYEGVRITLTQVGPALSPERSTTSDTNGHFSFGDVSPGPFELTVSSNGFTTQKVSILLHAGENYAAPEIVLPVSATISEVRVTASRVEVAEEQLKEEEKQRVFGAIPNFYVIYAPNAPPLNSRQKFHLAWRSSIDPFTFLATAGVAGIQQANDDFDGYGQGAKGYAKRYAANYADGFISNMIGGAILPSLLKQDPRYFYKGTGSIRSRALYAIANAVICKGDNGRWQFDYSGVIGSLAAAGISNIYYPAINRNGAGLTFENTLSGIGFSAVGNLFQEFLVRKLTPKVPNYGLSKP